MLLNSIFIIDIIITKTNHRLLGIKHWIGSCNNCISTGFYQIRKTPAKHKNEAVLQTFLAVKTFQNNGGNDKICIAQKERRCTRIPFLTAPNVHQNMEWNCFKIGKKKNSNTLKYSH